MFERGVGAGQTCWGAPAADQPPCADHVCKKGLVQGRLWVEGCTEPDFLQICLPKLGTVLGEWCPRAAGISLSYGDATD